MNAAVPRLTAARSNRAAAIARVVMRVGHGGRNVRGRRGVEAGVVALRGERIFASGGGDENEGEETLAHGLVGVAAIGGEHTRARDETSSLDDEG